MVSREVGEWARARYQEYKAGSGERSADVRRDGHHESRHLARRHCSARRRNSLTRSSASGCSLKCRSSSGAWRSRVAITGRFRRPIAWVVEVGRCALRYRARSCARGLRSSRRRIRQRSPHPRSDGRIEGGGNSRSHRQAGGRCLRQFRARSGHAWRWRGIHSASIPIPTWSESHGSAGGRCTGRKAVASSQSSARRQSAVCRLTIVTTDCWQLSSYSCGVTE